MASIGSVDPLRMDLGTMNFETKKFEKHLKSFLSKLTSAEGAKALLTVKREFIARVIQLTPVKDGRARAGWYRAAEALGVPTIPGPDPEAENIGRSEGRVKLVLTGTRKTIETVNGVPYIMKLEFGSSSQAPLGMVRVSLRRVIDRLPKEYMKEIVELWRITTVVS